ncbi:MAG: sulfite exporter TauE/SafE family protein [Pseudomonadota bacterium]
MSLEPSVDLLLFMGAVFLLAGLVKGVLGIGLPLVSLPLLMTVIEPITAMTLLVVPTFAVNLWQTAQSGYMGGALRRFWPAYPLLVAGMAVGVSFLTRLNTHALMILVGIVVIVIAVIQLLKLAFAIPERSERWCTPVVGLASGLLGGVTSFLGPLMIMYLVALRVDKDQFVGTIAQFYLIGAVPFFGGLALSGHLGWRELVASCGAAVMIWFGVLIGQVLRERASGDLFRNLVLGLLIVIGANMIRKGLM